MRLGRRERDDHAGEADGRPDREVELAGDEEKRHRRADDADLGGDVEIARDAAGGEEAAVPADEREENPEDDQSDRGADFGPLDEAPAERQLARARMLGDGHGHSEVSRFSRAGPDEAGPALLR